VAQRQDAALASDTASARVALLMAIGGGFDAAKAEHFCFQSGPRP